MANPREEVLSRLLAAIERSDEDAFLCNISPEAAANQVVNDQGQSWLHVLLERGMLRAAEAMIEYCDAFAPDSHGVTPLMIAAERGYADSCAQLLSAGSPNGSISVNAALSLAMKNQHTNVCRLLIAADLPAAIEALFQAISRDVASDVNVLLAAGLSADSKIETNKSARYAVHAAVGRLAIMRALVRNGANVNARDSNGRSPISIAAARGDLPTCELLLNEDAGLDVKDSRGRSPMFYACAYERDAVIKRFLECGESVDTFDNARRTPLFFHAERGHVNGCRLLLRFNADIFHKDVSKWTVFHVASSLGHRNVCRLFIDYLQASATASDHPLPVFNANPEEDEYVVCKVLAGPASWMSMASSSLLRVYFDLLSYGPKTITAKFGTLRIRDFAMNTLVHLAVERASDAQCIYLVRCLQSVGGVPVTTQNCRREMAVDLARTRGRTKIVDVLNTLGDLEGIGSFRVKLGGTISRSVGFPNILGPDGSTSRAFTECSRPRLAQLCRGIESGVYSLADEIVWQFDNERGDTVLHYFIRDFCERQGSFPSVTDQQSTILTAQWIGIDPRLVRAFLTKRNWEGKTPLHVAAQVGALGFCSALIERGAHPGEECSAADKRLVDPPNENIYYWRAINFAADVTARSSGSFVVSASEDGADDRAGQVWRQREGLVEFLLGQPDALPSHESAFDDVRLKIYKNFPGILPLLLDKMGTVWQSQEVSGAKELYLKFIADMYQSSGADQVNQSLISDQTGLALHNIFLETERNGIHVLSRYCVNECVIETTGDTLLHLVAAHGHSSGLAILRFLLTHGGMDVNRRNKQGKTALHVACERQGTADMCVFLLSNGADVTAACQNVKAPDVSLWFTPLYSALWASEPSLDVIEVLLAIPMSIVEPRNPRLGRSDQPQRGETSSARWNRVLLCRLVEVHPGALPLYLDHFAIEVNRLNGGMLYHFTEVRHSCRDLDLVLRPTTSLVTLHHKYSPSPCVTHPVIRNAIHLKWKLFGLQCHRRQLALYVLMLVFFYLANVILPKIDAVFNGDSPAITNLTQYKWQDFVSNVDYAVAVCKVVYWVLAAYHLVYVELYLEWRADRGRYWRSLWNLLDIGTYIIMVGTIPLEFCSDSLRVLRECLSGLLSVLLCVNLMQSLLVSSFFSVLIFTFARMCRVVGQFFFHYFLLLVGFTGGFHLLFHGYGPHTNFLSTMRVVFLATFGELDYLRNFYAADASPARNICGFVLLVLYVVVVMIVALNLLTALMTSEYENVRSQAEERALLELTGALQRYEQWLGQDVIDKLFSSPRGVTLLQACERRIPTHDARRGSQVSSNSLERWNRIARLHGRADLQAGLITSTPSASVTRASGPSTLSALDSTSDAIAAEVSRRVAEETATLRTEMMAKLQEIHDSMAVTLAHLPDASHSPPSVLGRSASARDVAHVEAKLDALLALVHAQQR